MENLFRLGPQVLGLLYILNGNWHRNISQKTIRNSENLRKVLNEVEKEERKTFIVTFGDKHCEITAMAFQLSQIIFRNELTNCKGALQFPLLIIYLS